MTKQKAFTIIELLVAIAIIAVLVGLLFPAIGAVRRTAKQNENNSKVRNIIQGMIAHSESHRGFFPGFDGFQFTNVDFDNNGSTDGYGQTVEARFWVLLDGSYLDGDAVISSQEAKNSWPNLEKPNLLEQKEVTTDNYSYAMSRIGGSTTDPDPFSSPSTKDKYRREEWRNEQNALAPIVTDRLAEQGDVQPEPGQPETYMSIHDGSVEGEWIGSIGRGDLSVEFSKEHAVSTRIAGFNNDDDDIFFENDSASADPEDRLKNSAGAYKQAENPVGIVE